MDLIIIAIYAKLSSSSSSSSTFFLPPPPPLPPIYVPSPLLIPLPFLLDLPLPSPFSYCCFRLSILRSDIIAARCINAAVRHIIGQLLPTSDLTTDGDYLRLQSDNQNVAAAAAADAVVPKMADVYPPYSSAVARSPTSHLHDANVSKQTIIRTVTDYISEQTGQTNRRIYLSCDSDLFSFFHFIFMNNACLYYQFWRIKDVYKTIAITTKRYTDRLPGRVKPINESLLIGGFGKGLGPPRRQILQKMSDSGYQNTLISQF